MSNKTHVVNEHPTPRSGRRVHGAARSGTQLIPPEPPKPEKQEIKRYNLNVPVELFDELQELAERKHTTVVDLLRRFIKLGIFAVQVADDPKAALIIRDDRGEREILMF